MEIENLIPVKSREDLRIWLQENGKIEKSCWLVVSMTPNPDTVLYLDAVEESLCFGWIDGVKKKISETELAQRLSPRSKRGSWTELNKERVRRLEKLGLMRDEGRKVLPDMDHDSFKIDRIIEQRLKEEMYVYENFMAFPALYQRIRIDNIQSYKSQPELFNSRLDKFITNTKENKMYGQWHDNGRLLDAYVK
ncbi:YdeI/OmpD-associated family protein [Paenibacillus sp. 19GGS1-52]|uniref:YdeI/OmpD-associated family protein n=1 Tax=Paenibacillus sp. 19GGS1-52 TaxID=2758563 RepID=UPI001EFA98A2|nr:YdeI/OmpD-associated family protein [Paenibacillus sp. 19GGS1-52]ULO04936.1 YdeI/OmpD-associated family protein [Paenibacillus sp. 19GGS1-52]